MKKVLLIIVMITYAATFPITAYSASTAERLEIDSYNLTESAVYIDLLIKMDVSDEFYTELNQNNMDRFDFDKTKLIEYCDKEGYISFSCHYKDIYSNLKLERTIFKNNILSRNSFTLSDSLGQNIYVMKDLFDKRRTFKIIVLDNDGNIIQTSEAFDIINDNGYLEYEVKYDVKDNTYELEWHNTNEHKLKLTVYNKILYVILSVLLFLILLLLYLIKRRHINKKGNNN